MSRFKTLAFVAALGAPLMVGVWMSAAADEKGVLPANYELLSAAEKEDIIWNDGILPSEFHGDLPALKSVNPLKLIFGALRQKLEDVTDEKSSSYEKSIHAHGVTAKVRFESTSGHEFTGLFEGASHGILRLSVTSDPKSSTFAPGLALKLFRDGLPSQNVSALFKLSGQKGNHNFFANELSNIVPVEFDPKSLFSTTVFKSVSRFPTQISVKAFGEYAESGKRELNANAPRQLYFVPRGELRFAEAEHDFRFDLLGIPDGSVLYDVYATSEHSIELLKSDEDRRKNARLIGRLVTTSRFVASSYGDDRLFFKHNAMDSED